MTKIINKKTKEKETLEVSNETEQDVKEVVEEIKIDISKLPQFIQEYAKKNPVKFEQKKAELLAKYK